MLPFCRPELKTGDAVIIQEFLVTLRMAISPNEVQIEVLNRRSNVDKVSVMSSGVRRVARKGTWLIEL